jgi:hypothetical protein
MENFFARLNELAQPRPFQVLLRAFPVACTNKTPAAQATIEQGDKSIDPSLFALLCVPPQFLTLACLLVS